MCTGRVGAPDSAVREGAGMAEPLLFLLRLLRRSPQGTVAREALPVTVSAGTASPVPDTPGGPPAPPPLTSTCKQQVEPSPCQWHRLHPPPEAWLLSPSTHPQAWSALNLDLLVPLRPLEGEGVRIEGRRGAKGSSPQPCKGNSGPSREHGT